MEVIKYNDAEDIVAKISQLTPSQIKELSFIAKWQINRIIDFVNSRDTNDDITIFDFNENCIHTNHERDDTFSITVDPPKDIITSRSHFLISFFKGIGNKLGIRTSSEELLTRLKPFKNSSATARYRML